MQLLVAITSSAILVLFSSAPVILCLPVSNPETHGWPLEAKLVANRDGLAIGDGAIRPGVYNIISYQTAKSMRSVPQWHCLRYRKFDLVKRCRNYRVGRRTWRNEGGTTSEDIFLQP